jgi:hypothetical protein
VPRFPLWTTLIPLLVGAGGYWLVWHRFSEQFAADLTRILPSQTASVSGFPYRLEAGFDEATLHVGNAPFHASLSAGRMILNRGPWQPELTVMRSTDAALAMAITSVAGATVSITAPAAQGSLRRSDNRIVRLSLVFNHAKLAIGGLPIPVSAGTFEVHFREQLGTIGGTKGPTLPARWDGVVHASDLRFTSGDALTLSASFSINAKAPLESYTDWADGGTIEVVHFRLADATGEILDGAATVAPAATGTLRINGSLTTTCPETVRAAFSGRSAPHEMRLRAPVRLAFGGDGTALTVDAPAAGLGSLPRRGQLPPCPSIRR